MADMISYVTIGADDTDAAARFYDAALGALGHKQLWRNGAWVGYGPDADHCKVMICGPADGQPARHGNGIMVGLHADSTAQVDAFHAAAMANGGSDEGAPGPRPDYGEGYYLAYVRDPTGNKLSAFYKG
jgi:catechol 2,3-dioxygenase-like lactoylglutathione lyase family enzyme